MEKKLRRYKIIFWVLWVFPCFLFAQPANQWIDYSLRYFKIPIYKDGLYRIDSLTLANAGIDLSVVSPKNFKMYAMGKEIPLYIEGEADNYFNTNDYIEFYAEKNKGWADTVLYGSLANTPNPYYSLFTDTAYYFLTWDNLTNHLRVSTENDVNFAGYTPAAYVLKEVVYFLPQQFYPGETNPYGGTDIEVVPTEGFFSYPFNKGSYVDYYIPTENPVSGAMPAEVEISFTGQSDYENMTEDHHVQVWLGSATSPFLDTIYGGYKLIRYNFTAPVTVFSNSTLLRLQSINDLSAQYPNYVDRNAFCYVRILYPRSTNLGGNTSFTFILEDDQNQLKSYVTLTSSIITQPVVWDVTNGIRITAIATGGNIQMLIPNSGNRKQICLTDANQIQYITNLIPAGNGGYFIDYAAMNLDSAYIVISHPLLMTEAQAYAAYRNITGFNAMVADIEQLYDQYSFGIKKTPLAIRNFVSVLMTQWGNPSYLFIIGKGIKYNEIRFNSTNFSKCLVPTYGYPGSDIRLTAGLNGQPWQPAVATGRLAATTPVQVSDYMNKVMLYESAPQEEWKKNILHFAGGTDINQANWFKGYLDAFKQVLEDTSFGGKVTTFMKTVSVPIQTSLADSIKGLIKKGASLMTFFGHASATGGFDQNLDDPSTWDNYGKYPFLVGNACYAGDIHGAAAPSVSEQYTLIPQEGVIGFLASVELGFTSYLFDYSYELFKQIGQKNYGKPIGHCIKQNILVQQNLGVNDPFRKSVSWEMTLHGDPALVINSPSLPDYMIREDRVYFEPENLSTEVDTFTINVIITNQGKAINTPLSVSVKRKFPNSSKADTLYFSVINAPYYKDTFSVKMPVDFLNGIGLNVFEISVDDQNLIQELDETNNFILLTKEIRAGNIVPIYPYNYAIVPQQGVILKASTGNPFEHNRTYVFEIDTTDTYDSPLKQSTQITSVGGVLTWAPPLLQSMPDSQVYFWRVSPDSSYYGEYLWKEFSFQYIPGKRGWSQDHFFQFKNDEYLYLNHNRVTRKFEFYNTTRNVYCQNIGMPAYVSDLYNVLWKIDFEMQDYGACGWYIPSMHVAVIDSLDLQAWGTYACDPANPVCGNCLMLNANHQFGNANNGCNQCRARVEKYFIFRVQDPTQMVAMRDMINNAVPAGNYLLVYSVYYPLFSQWDAIDPSIKQAFINLGATQIQTLTDSVPYIFFTRKGDPSATIEVVGQTNTDTISLTVPIQGSASFGYLKSELIGAARRWDSLFVDFHSLEYPSADTILLNIIGVDQAQNETILLSQLFAQDIKMNINSLVDAQQYPYLRLEAYFRDDSLKTSPQLDYWMVTYEPVPEAALAPNLYFSFYRDTLQEGDKVKMSVAIKNVSEFDMDSLKIEYAVYDRFKIKHPIAYPRQKPLLADSVLISSIEFDTYGYPQLNSLYIDVNPNNDQPEQYHFNNWAEIPFYVLTDKENPLLDVTFDGIHILDGDIVSAKPEIVITLKDENPYLMLDDTADFEIYLRYPNESQYKRIYFADNTGAEILHFTPGEKPKNKAKIVWNASFPQDGIYTLKVQASDKSKNKSGAFEYRINFEVINKPTITQVLNYPNPFSTSTRFVFVLTGSQIPEIFKIQIMTITGKVVKEINKEELGPLRIGRNITEYAWDGTDQFGDRLANGVYLYRVITRLNGQEIELRNTQADQYFVKGFGKMYLFR